MPAVVVPNAAELTLNWSGNGETWHNVMGLALAPGFDMTDAEAETLAQVVRDAWAFGGTNFLRQFLADGTKVETVKVTDLRTLPHPTFERPGTSADSSGGTFTMPIQDAVCVSLSTGHPGRSGRGRIYLAGWTPTGNITGSYTIDPARLAGALNFVQLIKDGIDTAYPAGDVFLGVVSKTLLERFAVTAVSIKSHRWCTQRRRAA